MVVGNSDQYNYDPKQNYFKELQKKSAQVYLFEFIGGHDLSVGQWQRLAIARAFFRDASVIVLDEPSSALDPEAEAQLFENIRELCVGRAVVIISHRFSTVTSADRIYVLEHGLVVDQGSHRELMEAGGEYARLFTIQAERYLDPS
jgi:ATP-binding cassette subfamily B protein